MGRNREMWMRPTTSAGQRNTAVMTWTAPRRLPKSPNPSRQKDDWSHVAVILGGSGAILHPKPLAPSSEAKKIVYVRTLSAGTPRCYCREDSDELRFFRRPAT